MASAVPAAVDDFDWEGDVRCQHSEEDLVRNQLPTAASRAVSLADSLTVSSPS
jgi:hypothetical protein